MSCAGVVVPQRALNILEALDRGRPYVHVQAHGFQRLTLGGADFASVCPDLSRFKFP